MSDAVATSFGTLNYSGMLFNKGNTRTPLSSAIGMRAGYTDHVEFVMGQEYTGGMASPTQPAITEEASLTAPDATRVTRAQKTNVTQIFHEAVYVSYAHQSNMGTLSGANIANQTANPINELDFQVAAKMQEIGRKIEYTFVQGAYQKASADNVANKSRGLTTAITTNTKAMGSNPLGLWDVADVMKTMYEANVPTDRLVLWVNPVTLFQLNADAEQNGLTIVPAAYDYNGIKVDKLITPMGEIGVRLGECLPSGTALVLNLEALRPMYQPVPGKGNFFLEELAKTGAGAKYQIFGQVGLDYTNELLHAKITGIATTFTKPDYKKTVVISGTPNVSATIANTTSNPVPTQEVEP